MSKSIRRMKFEDAMQQLDQIVAAMESGEIGIEESITRYEEAMKLADHCRKILDQAEQRIRKIHADSADTLNTSPLEAPDESFEDDHVDDQDEPDDD